jgi:hypothetical protein
MPKRLKKPVKPITAKQRAADDELRALLHNVDMEKFGQLLKKAVKPAR